MGGPHHLDPASRPPTGAPSGAAREHPFDRTRADELGPMGSAGRKLPGRAPAPAPAPEVSPPQPPDRPGRSPFAAYAPDASTMGAHTAEARSQSVGVIAIVAGLLFVMAGGMAAALLMAVGVYIARDEISEAILDDEQGHQFDTGSGAPILPPPPPPRTGRGGHGGGVAPAQPTGPRPGPATITVSSEKLFHSFEIDCPMNNFSARGRFRKGGGETMTATVRNVPPGESCRVTFQGGEPATTRISAYETKQCTFNPTICYLR
ncbi:MAG TPA: hypothetical protein ENK18_01595 [Deltaproteobacteria bacterium]|nr:hypothetical protein [Deltaproteobacteria bacterium]